MKLLKPIEVNPELNDVVREIKGLEVDCPECIYMDDDQYTCTTCWCQGGNGRLNVYEFITQKMHKEIER